MSNKLATLVATFVVFILFSRGLLEQSLGQKNAYVVQYATVAFTLLLTLLSARRDDQTSPLTRSASTVVFLLFIAVLVISSLLTVLDGFYYFWAYALIMAFLAAVVFFGAHLRFLGWANLQFVFGVNALIMVTVATLSQLHVIPLTPGSEILQGLVRPASWTGSKQHYAILIAVLSLIFLQCYLSLRSWVGGALFALCFVSTFASLTRSGLVILVLALIIGTLLMFTRRSSGKREKRRLRTIYTAAALIILLVGAVFPQFIVRALSSGDLNDAANVERVEAWQKGIELWLKGPVVVGNSVGIVTQATGKLFPLVGSFQVESGWIQQVVNFGLVGCLLFFLQFAFLYVNISFADVWLRALIPAFVIQNIFYMSIEVLPIVVIIAWLPSFSKSLKKGVL